MYNLFQLGLNEYKLGVYTKQYTFSVKQKVRYNHNLIGLFNKKFYYFIFGGGGVFFNPCVFVNELGLARRSFIFWRV